MKGFNRHIMTNRVLLNNVDHAHLRVISGGSATRGGSVNQALIVPAEFEEAQREYPIVFRRDPDGAYQAVVLLGLDKGENLFANGAEWSARYIPAVLRRGPFFIGMRERESFGEVHRETAIYLDIDDPRVNETEGEPLFLPHGGNSPYLEQVARALHTVQEGLGTASAMFSLFEDLDLIKPVRIELQLGDGKQYDLPDLHTIDTERLAVIEAQGLEKLARSGFLAMTIFASSSLGNMARLIELKTRQLEDR
jgi:hypothetical protein